MESFPQVRTLTSPHVDGHVPTAFVKELGEGTIDVAPTPEAQHSVEALVQAQRLPSGQVFSNFVTLMRVRLTVATPYLDADFGALSLQHSLTNQPICWGTR